MPPVAAGFDEWESAGNHGWGWDGISPYLRKFFTVSQPDAKLQEHADINWIEGNTSSINGPIQASFTDSPGNPLGKAWVDTFKTLGADLTADPFSGRSTGGFSCPSSIDPISKTRSYSASAYYALAAERMNLKVILGATADKILLEGTSTDGGLAAHTVIFRTQDGTEHKAQAKCEVILAAGAFQTPKLLELSGIGGRRLLEKLGITCKLDMPAVGENLQDHLMTGISFEVTDGIMTGDALLRQEPGIVDLFVQMYQEHKAGPFASGSLTSYAFTPIMSGAIGQLDASAHKGLEDAVADLAKYPCSPSERSHADFFIKMIRAQSEATGALFAIPAQVNLHNGPEQIGLTTNPVEGNYLSLGSMLLHPLSRGSSHVASSDSNVPPIIDPRYLSHPLDIEVYARHLMFIEVLAKTEPLASFLKANGRRAQPGPNRGEVDTVEKAKEYIRATALSNNHPVGTCAMLPRDQGGVVDAELKVYGVDKLRIVDSSIMPFIPMANTQTTVYAVAEKAADLIQKTYNLGRYS